MGRDDHALWAVVGNDLHECLGVQSQNRSAIRTQVSEAGKLLVDFLNRLKIRGEEEDMDFPHFSIFGIDEADLCGENKGDVLSGKGKSFEVAVLGGDDVFQTEKAVSGGLQFLLEKKQPFWMCEVSCGEKLYTLYLGPVGEGIEDHLARGSSGEFRVDVKVRDVFHRG